MALLVERGRMKAFAGRLAAAYDAHLASLPHLREVVRGGRRTTDVQACGPFDTWARSRVADRAILVGDAGGYLDPITGEGISLALQDALRRDDLSAGRLRAYHERLERASRHARILTRAMLGLVRHRWLASSLVRRLACCPELYSSLLAINCGVRTFWDLRLADLLRFVAGRRQASHHAPCQPARRKPPS